MLPETDVLVVGGGPAGLAAAIACRARGFRVAVADAARPPIDKSCGEGLMPDSLAALARLGISVDAASGFAYRGIRFRGCGTAVDASFPRGTALGVRRTVLHELLRERAGAMGVELLWGERVSGIPEVRCKWLIGADGQNSRVRQWAGLDACRRESKRFGFRRHYRVAPWTDCVEIYWGQGCQIYVTPVAGDEVGIALISGTSGLRLDEALGGFPELNAKLRGAAHASVEKGAVTATRRLRRVTKGNVALVGDASGSVDAITGEGLCLSFLQALSLAEALERGRLSDYEVAHARLMKRPEAMGDLMLLLDRRAWLRERVLPALAARPEIFAKMLAMHVGAVKPVHFVMNAIVPLGWRMLYARS